MKGPVLHVVGARPNFMKLAPVYRAIDTGPRMVQKVVHSGQHYDIEMSEVFFEHLGLRPPDANLGIGSGSHAEQTARAMLALEPYLEEWKPELTVVYGDVNSTLAAALTCAKRMLPVAHVEAGLRSFNQAMPEEVNRRLTDHLSTWLFTHSEEANRNLEREGIPGERVHFVGNVMIDTLVACLPAATARWPGLERALALDGKFGLATVHRPANVDDPRRFETVVSGLAAAGEVVPIVWPVHPRTKGALGRFSERLEGKVRLVAPLGYLDFLALEAAAAFVITDSGGVQEETTFLGTPCFTIREETERPVTVTVGTNRIVSPEPSALVAEVRAVLDERGRRGRVPDLWDGHAAERIASVLRG